MLLLAAVELLLVALGLYFFREAIIEFTHGFKSHGWVCLAIAGDFLFLGAVIAWFFLQ